MAGLTKDNLHFTLTAVIGSFRHRGLKRLYKEDDASKLPAESVPRIRRILAALDAAKCPGDLDVYTFRLRRLKGQLRGFWAVTVRANWRIVFRFRGRYRPRYRSCGLALKENNSPCP